MNTNTVRTLFVLFLLAHGWVHFSLTQVPLPQPGALRTPFFPSWWRNAVDPQWPASKLGLAPETTRTMGWILWVMVVALYVLSAVLLFTMASHPGLWQGFMAGASVLSLIFLALYWHPWLPVGVLIDVVLIAGTFFHWPFLQFAK